MTRILTGACSLLLIAPTIMAQPVTAVGGTQSLAPENAAVASIAPHNGAISGANQDEGDDISVRIRITTPLLGPLVSYWGKIRIPDGN